MTAAPAFDAILLLQRYRNFLSEYDAREPRYRPRRQLTKVGEALLLHRAIEAMDASKVVQP